MGKLQNTLKGDLMPRSLPTVKWANPSGQLISTPCPWLKALTLGSNKIGSKDQQTEKHTWDAYFWTAVMITSMWFTCVCRGWCCIHSRRGICRPGMHPRLPPCRQVVSRHELVILIQGIASIHGIPTSQVPSKVRLGCLRALSQWKHRFCFVRLLASTNHVFLFSCRSPRAWRRCTWRRYVQCLARCGLSFFIQLIFMSR